MSGEKVHLDDVWVYGHSIRAGNGFRRITYLSLKHVAIVGVNVRVDCTNGATTDDCSIPPPTTGANSTAPSTVATQDLVTEIETTASSIFENTTPTHPVRIKGKENIKSPRHSATYSDAIPTPTVVIADHSPKSNCVIKPHGSSLTNFTVPQCTGIGIAAGIVCSVLLATIVSTIICCIYCKNSKQKQKGRSAC